MTPWTVPGDAWAGQAAFILGGGPSLKGFDVERLRGRGKVIGVNNAGLDLAPWCDVLFWADQRWLDWNHERLHLHTGEWKVSRKRPHLLLNCDVKFMTFRPRRLSHWPDSLGGWCGGSSAINLAYLLGSKVIVLLGFDMHDLPLDRWREGNWHDKHQLPPVEGQRRNKFIPVLEAMAPDLERAGVLVINTNRRSALRCFPFADIEELLAMDDIALAEREKYLAVWQRPEYRKVSPGMLECDRALAVCEMKSGQSLIDFGAGPCRAALWFQERGIDVLAIDFAPNARETDVPFIEACLWDLPDDLPKADFGFCTDVMEHIPAEKIDAVLANIASLTKRAAYFRIATRPDKMGPKLLNQPLHMTVQGGDWWRRQVEAHFPLVDVIENTGRDVMLLARP